MHNELKLLIHPHIDDQRLVQVVSAAGRMRVVNAVDDAMARREIVDADAFFGKITADLLAAASRLRWIQSPTASLEHYIFPELVEHPAALTNMRGLFSDVIADQVMGYVICFARNLHTYIRNQMEARWSPLGGDSERMPTATGPAIVSDIDRNHRQLSDQSLGIVGFGHIGAEIARRARAFGMRVRAVDSVVKEPTADVESIGTLNRLDEMLGDCDYVVIAAPHTPETAGMFDRDRLQRMRRSAYLINIGRGAIVRLDDLVAALDAGELAGAALDVYEVEPLPSDHRLWRFPNVILTPHVAGYSPRIAERHLQLLLANIRRFADQQPLLNVVMKDRWY